MFPLLLFTFWIACKLFKNYHITFTTRPSAFASPIFGKFCVKAQHLQPLGSLGWNWFRCLPLQSLHMHVHIHIYIHIHIHFHIHFHVHIHIHVHIRVRVLVRLIVALSVPRRTGVCISSQGHMVGSSSGFWFSDWPFWMPNPAGNWIVRAGYI